MKEASEFLAHEPVGVRTLFEEDNPALSKVMQILNRTTCSEQTLRLKMKRYDFEEPQVDQAIEKAKEMKFLDDEAFAASFAEHEICVKARSRRIARMKLLQKGIAEEVIEKVLGEINIDDEDARAKEFLNNKLQHLMDTAQSNAYSEEPDLQKIKQRLYGIASRRDINYSLVKQVFDEFDFKASSG